jgi:hypothetical protein
LAPVGKEAAIKAAAASRTILLIAIIRHLSLLHNGNAMTDVSFLNRQPGESVLDGAAGQRQREAARLVKTQQPTSNVVYGIDFGNGRTWLEIFLARGEEAKPVRSVIAEPGDIEPTSPIEIKRVTVQTSSSRGA